MEALVVSLLVLSPIELPVPSRVPQSYWTEMKNLALKLEVSGPRCPWLDPKINGTFESEIRWLRCNWRDCLDCPSMGEIKRLPEAGRIREMLEFNRVYRDYLEHRRSVCLHRWDWYTDAISQAEQSFKFWELAQTAATDCYVWHINRKALKSMKESIGDEAFEEGRWPAIVPWDRFVSK